MQAWIREVVERVVDQYTSAEDRDIDLDALVQAMKDCTRPRSRSTSCGKEVGVDREALIDEFAEDALDEYKAKEESFGEHPDTGQPPCASWSAS